MKEKYKIVLLAGGDSCERDISLASARAVIEAIDACGHEVIAADPANPSSESGAVRKQIIDAGISVDPPPPAAKTGRGIFIGLIQKWKEMGADIIFNSLHGGYGEDGTIQSVFEFMGMPFTGSGSAASMLAMDKRLSRTMAESAGIPVPEGFVIDSNDEVSMESMRRRIENGPGYPLVIKPAGQGSSVGLSVVRGDEKLREAVETAGLFSSGIIVERYISGSEITVTVLGSEAMPIIEIKPKSGLYDYKHKYMTGTSEYVVPAPLDEGLSKEFGNFALGAFKLLGCSIYGRVDFRLSDDGKPYFLEVNTLPGMTASSLVPKSAAAAGMDFRDLIDRILALSLREKRENH